jgi:hypothetical protein
MSTTIKRTSFAKVSVIYYFVLTIIYFDNPIECATMIPGCQQCYQEVLGSSYVVRCFTCQDGLYLLANQTGSSTQAGFQGNLFGSSTLYYPEAFSFCVPDCRRAHHAYVNNPATGNCTFCGANCQSCNPRTGCEICSIEESRVGWVNASLGASPMILRPN